MVDPTGGRRLSLSPAAGASVVRLARAEIFSEANRKGTNPPEPRPKGGLPRCCQACRVHLAAAVERIRRLGEAKRCGERRKRLGGKCPKPLVPGGQPGDLGQRLAFCDCPVFLRDGAGVRPAGKPGQGFLPFSASCSSALLLLSCTECRREGPTEAWRAAGFATSKRLGVSIPALPQQRSTSVLITSNGRHRTNVVP